MRYSKWVGMAACLLLIVVCFIPWTYHADIQKNFTGFFSENNAYGRPGKFIVFFCVISLLLLLARKVWAQRVLLFVAGTLVAYSIKTYILYTSCYNAYCPEKQAGIFLLIFLALIIFASALFSDLKLQPKQSEEPLNP